MSLFGIQLRFNAFIRLTVIVTHEIIDIFLLFSPFRVHSISHAQLLGIEKWFNDAD